MMPTMKSIKKKAQNFPILILIPISQNQIYIYQPKHVFFFKFIMAEEKSGPSKKGRRPSQFWMDIESHEVVA